MPHLVAVWNPGWYELDQRLSVGLREEFSFLRPAKAGTSKPLEFYNTLWRAAHALVLTGTIVSITHATLGALQAVHTVGLDYRFVLASGVTLIVNAEEEPGRLEQVEGAPPGREPQAPESWQLSVVIAAEGPPRPAAAGQSRRRAPGPRLSR